MGSGQTLYSVAFSVLSPINTIIIHPFLDFDLRPFRFRSLPAKSSGRLIGESGQQGAPFVGPRRGEHVRAHSEADEGREGTGKARRGRSRSEGRRG